MHNRIQYLLPLGIIAYWIAGVPVASAAPRALIPGESQVTFVVKEMGVPFPGKFTRFDANIDIDSSSPEKSNASVRIDIGTLTTGNEEADALAQGPDWLDKLHAPFATFKSTSLREISKDRFEARGTLSIRNVSSELTIPITTSEQPGGKTAIASEFIIRRKEFGIGGGVWNQPGVVAEEIPVKVRFTLAPAAAGKSGTTGTR
jgi:polyisoprenoid-binding protein YceI